MQLEASRASACDEGHQDRNGSPGPSVQHIGLTVAYTADGASDLFKLELAHNGTAIAESAGLISVNLHRSRPPYARSDPLVDRFLRDGFPRRAVPERAQRLNRGAPGTLDHRQLTLVQVDILIEARDPLELA